MESLAQTMSVEAIAAIKAKRMAMKRHERNDTEDSKRKQRELQRQVDEHKENVCKRAMERERRYLTYEEQLMGKKEMPGVLRTLALVFDINKRRMRPKAEAGATTEPGKLRKESSSRYNRYDQEKFLKGQEAFGINPLGSNLNKSKDAGKEAGKEADKKADKEIGKKLSKDSQKERSHSSYRHSTAHRYHRRSTKPIIVVPASLSSLITIHNAKKLLQEMRFVPTEQIRKPGPQLTEEVIERRVQGELVRYRVIDNVKHLKDSDWDRVAAVFAMGPQWQFKGWPHGGDPAAIFHEVCAFHLHFKDSMPSKELRNLKVHMLALPQHERHSDCGVLKEFWKKLDHHIALRPSQFAFMKQK